MNANWRVYTDCDRKAIRQPGDGGPRIGSALKPRVLIKCGGYSECKKEAEVSLSTSKFILKRKSGYAYCSFDCLNRIARGESFRKNCSESRLKYFKEHPNHLEERAAAVRLSYIDNPEKHKAHSARIKKHFSKPGSRKVASDAQLKRYEDPKQHELQSANRLKYLAEHPGGKYSNTAPELAVKAFLDESEIKYEHSKHLGRAVVDFLLPEHNVIIEVDGCIYHACEICYPEPDGWICKTIEDRIDRNYLEAAREDKLRDAGYTVVRIFEHEVNTKDFRKLSQYSR